MFEGLRGLRGSVVLNVIVNETLKKKPTNASVRDETNVRAGNAQTRLRAIHALKKRLRRGRKACILGDDILNQVAWSRRTIAVLSTECCEWEEIRMENNTGQLSVVGKTSLERPKTSAEKSSEKAFTNHFSVFAPFIDSRGVPRWPCCCMCQVYVQFPAPYGFGWSDGPATGCTTTPSTALLGPG